MTKEVLDSLLKYDRNTGIFTWIKARRAQSKDGEVAGFVRPNKYIHIKINDKSYYAHRLAWLTTYGHVPNGQVDHINGVRSDNRIENLRLATNRTNQMNRSEHRSGKLVGARFHKTKNKWEALIKINGKRKYLGVFQTEREAHNCYIAKIAELQGGDEVKGESVDAYIARVLPCTPPCDSFGVCENCCDATLIRVGAEIEKRNLNSALEKAEAENLRLFTEMTNAAIEHPCYKLSKELEAENKRLMERIDTLERKEGWICVACGKFAMKEGGE